MSAFALSGIAVALKKLNSAVEKIETYCDSDGDANVAPLMGEAHADLLGAKGELTAVMQLIEMHRIALLERAETERPPQLRVVK